MFDTGGSGGATARSVGALTGALGAGDRRAARCRSRRGGGRASWRRRCCRCGVSRPGWRRWWPSRPRRSRPGRCMRRMGRGRRRIGSRSTPGCRGARSRARCVTPAGSARCLDTRAAFRAGDLSAAHVRVLCRLAGHPRAGRHFPDGEAHLVARGAGCGSTTGNACVTTGATRPIPTGPNSGMAATPICAGSASVSASTGWGMPTATSPRWPPPRSTGRWRGSNASCSRPIGPRPRRSTATPPPRRIWPARLRSGATTP